MISTVEKVLFLKSDRSVPGRSPPKSWRRSRRSPRSQPLSAGDQVFAQGEPGDALYLIVEGKVKVHQGRQGAGAPGRAETLFGRWPCSIPSLARPA